MKNIVIFLGLLGVVAFGFGNYLVMAIALGAAALIMYFGFFKATWDMSKFYNRLPTTFQDIPEILELAKETVFFREGVDYGSARDFYSALEDDPDAYEIRFDIPLMDAFEEKYDAELFHYYDVSPRTRALFHYFIAVDKHPTDLQRLIDIAQAIMVKKRLDGKLQRSKKWRVSFWVPVFN